MTLIINNIRTNLHTNIKLGKIYHNIGTTGRDAVDPQDVGATLQEVDVPGDLHLLRGAAPRWCDDANTGQ